ncbi:hypothetical protein PIB30_090994 [Stylosanthes scabra]|uniref:Uncharacterized protein n=1 Tax=Stylosanthes scabra TaxID=79078 RepID=A0ABU6SVV0_9FABA|nr:hypothetical protein [Stylosanthes scabra]
MGHDNRTGFFFWEWFMALDWFNPLRRIGLATDQVSVLSDLRHSKQRLMQGLGVVPFDYVIRATRAGYCPACLRTKLEGSLPKGCNDHPVPHCRCGSFVYALVTGSSPFCLEYLGYHYVTCCSQRNMAALDQPRVHDI